MTIIGIISDTHGYFDPKIKEHFADCDQIWHLGDIGNKAVLDELQKLKPTLAVYGNIDEKEIEWKLNENEILELEGLRFLLTHIAGKPPKYNKRVLDLLKAERIDVLVCGHSHQNTVLKDRENGIVFINPGASGQQGFHKYRFVIKVWVDNKKITNLERIKLGNR